jgi:hypothetical protein
VPTEIPNYVPLDKGWSVVVGPFMRKPKPKQPEKLEPDTEAPAAEDSE